MKQIRNTAVMEALSETSRAYGIKLLAPELDKEPSSLYGELNPYGDQGKAKLSFDDAIEIMRITRRFEAMELALGELGLRASPADSAPDKDDVRDEMLDDCRMLRDFHEAIRRGDHPNSIRILFNAIHNEINQSMTSYDMEYAKGEKHHG